MNVKTHVQLIKQLMRRPGVRAEMKRIEREVTYPTRRMKKPHRSP